MYVNGLPLIGIRNPFIERIQMEERSKGFIGMSGVVRLYMEEMHTLPVLISTPLDRICPESTLGSGLSGKNEGNFSPVLFLSYRENLRDFPFAILSIGKIMSF
jgi:hypothetical protein